HRFGEIRTMQIGTLSLLAGLALMPLPVLILPSPTAMLLFIVFLVLVPVGTALLFPASTSLVSQRTSQHELGLTMGARQPFGGVVSIVGPIGGTFLFDRLGHGVPFSAAAAVVGVAGVLAFRERAPREIGGLDAAPVARSESDSRPRGEPA